MIEFKCGVCGELMEADYANAGRNAQCLKCGTVVQIPFPEMLPRIACNACEAELDFPVSKAGNIERCPKCGALVRLPTVEGQGGGGCLGLSSLVGGVLLGLAWLALRA